MPEESTLLAITTAAARGLDAELCVSEIGDQKLVHHAQRCYYEALLLAGVKIHLHAAPTVLHTKHFTIDDDIAVIGSSNMEVSVMIQGHDFVQGVRRIEDGYRANSRQLVLEDWTDRPAGENILDNLARLTSSLQ